MPYRYPASYPLFPNSPTFPMKALLGLGPSSTSSPPLLHAPVPSPCQWGFQVFQVHPTLGSLCCIPTGPPEALCTFAEKNSCSPDFAGSHWCLTTTDARAPVVFCLFSPTGVQSIPGAMANPNMSRSSPCPSLQSHLFSSSSARNFQNITPCYMGNQED